MKSLVNNYDKSVEFTDLEKAKKYYGNGEKPKKEEYLGNDFEEYCTQFEEYTRQINESNTLEELAEVLNRYTDIFDNGTTYKVITY